MPAPPRTARSRLTAMVAGATLTGMLAGVAAISSAAPATPETSRQPSSGRTAISDGHVDCAIPTTGRARCLSVVRTGPAGQLPTGPAADLRPFTAADLQDAYRLPSTLLGARQTVAVVVPFDNPNAASDLAVYREANNLPACTSDFPCFRKVDQRGGTDYPPPSPAWAPSSSTALDMVSAACPNCRLLLVEADDATFENLGLAVDQAAALGADVIAAAYGGSEYDGQAGAGGHYDHPGVPITAPSGNGGFASGTGRQHVPSAYTGVISVGGTFLSRAANARGWSEQAWRSTGSGCSLYVPKPPWQIDGLCDNRTASDVAAVADPATPVAVYDSFGSSGWIAAGGTTVGAALIAGVYALAGNSDSIAPAEHLYRHRKHLFDVVSGSNGVCGGSYLCTATTGYDGPTGLGTPNGIGAF